MTACWSLSIEFSIRFSLSSMSATLSWIVFLKDAMSPVFLVNSFSLSATTCSAISEIVSGSIVCCGAYWSCCEYACGVGW